MNRKIQRKNSEVQYTVILWLSAIMLLTSFSAIAVETKVVEVFADDAFGQHRYSRILVIDLSENLPQRIEVESRLVDAMRDTGVTAIAGHSLSLPVDGTPIEILDVAISEQAVDAMLVTHAVDMRRVAEIERDVQATVPECECVNDERISRGSEFDSRTSFTIANLYDASDSVRVLTVRTTCSDAPSWSESLAVQASALSEFLARSWFGDSTHVAD